jgi:hypothetical protein
MTAEGVPAERRTVPGPRARGRWKALAGAIVVLAVALLVVLFTIPYPRSSTNTFTVLGAGPQTFSYNQSLCPVGARATIAYSSDPPVNVTLRITGPDGSTLWDQASTHGTITFPVPICGAFGFLGNDTAGGKVVITVSIAYSAPAL